MALKAVLATKAELDALPETVRGLYKDSDGRFVLDAEGMVFDEDYQALNTKLGEFRTNNIALQKKLDALKDVDPDEYRRVKAELDTLKATTGGKKIDDINAAIAAAVEKATKPLADKVDGLTTERDTAKKALEQKETNDALWQVGVKAGVREEARDFWLSEAGKVFRRDEKTGALTAFNGDQQLFSKRRGKATEPLSAEEWALEHAPQQPNLAILYKGSGGSGAQQQQLGPGGQRIISRESGDAISNNLDAIAKGTVTVQ